MLSCRGTCELLLPLAPIPVESVHVDFFFFYRIFSCEMIGAFKPNPKAYQRPLNWLNLDPSEVALVVRSHFLDLFFTLWLAGWLACL